MYDPLRACVVLVATQTYKKAMRQVSTLANVAAGRRRIRNAANVRVYTHVAPLQERRGAKKGSGFAMSFCRDQPGDQWCDDW